MYEEHSLVRRKQLRFSVLYASLNDAFAGHGVVMVEDLGLRLGLGVLSVEATA